MAASLHEDSEIGFDEEDGMLWLPSHVLDEACGNKAYMMHCQRNLVQLRQQKQQQLLHNKMKMHPKASCRPHQRSKLANGGPGMQAIFLESGQRPSGTGVFLPQAGKNFQSTKKPACAPVLLPTRVVEALNLNVRALGLQISPRQDPKDNPRSGYKVYNDSTRNKNVNRDPFSNQRGIIYHDENTSPEIFLPKEWTY